VLIDIAGTQNVEDNDVEDQFGAAAAWEAIQPRGTSGRLCLGLGSTVSFRRSTIGWP
jgi:hypothetical protein